jgi:hypothetical protein
MTELGGAGARDRSAAAPDPVREEAERLVAAGLAAVSMAAERIGAPTRERGGAAAVGFDALGDVLFGRSGHRRHSVANGSEVCCRCPVCRAISAAREPSPELAEALATGFGALAQGAARVLRGLADVAGAEPDRTDRPAQPDHADPWAAATAEPPGRSGPGHPGGGAAGGGAAGGGAAGGGAAGGGSAGGGSAGGAGR